MKKVLIDVSVMANFPYEISGIQRVILQLCPLLKENTLFQLVRWTPKGYIPTDLETKKSEVNAGKLRLLIHLKNFLPSFIKDLLIEMKFKMLKVNQDLVLKDYETIFLMDTLWAMPVSYLNHLKKAHLSGIKIIPLWYDLFPMMDKISNSKHFSKKFERYFTTLMSFSTDALAISEYTKNCILNHPAYQGGSITAIKLGTSFGASDQLSEIHTIKDQFILCVGRMDYYKNIPFLVEAFETSKIPENVKLVLVARPSKNGGEFQEKLKNHPRIIWIYGISNKELAWLYQKALLVVVPSLYEGFGLPVVEALSCGKFVLSSDGGSLPEVGGPWVDYVHPDDMHQLRRLLETYLNNEALLKMKSDNIKENYRAPTWDHCRQQIEQFFSDHGQ